jgi:hypothetical protein
MITGTAAVAEEAMHNAYNYELMSMAFPLATVIV